MMIEVMIEVMIGREMTVDDGVFCIFVLASREIMESLWLPAEISSITRLYHLEIYDEPAAAKFNVQTGTHNTLSTHYTIYSTTQPNSTTTTNTTTTPTTSAYQHQYPHINNAIATSTHQHQYWYININTAAPSFPLFAFACLNWVILRRAGVGFWITGSWTIMSVSHSYQFETLT